ncbi:hypothetical protein, partial [Shinella yambaruensis]|uniref:hypothetical protein n=1 Tax=Shinella yambaruensis TaxID=415996 RepID=UPI0024E0FA82
TSGKWNEHLRQSWLRLPEFLNIEKDCAPLPLFALTGVKAHHECKAHSLLRSKLRTPQRRLR